MKYAESLFRVFMLALIVSFGVAAQAQAEPSTYCPDGNLHETECSCENQGPPQPQFVVVEWICEVSGWDQVEEHDSFYYEDLCEEAAEQCGV